MSKTFAPQFVRELRRLALYAVRHQPKMYAVMTPAQQDAVEAVKTASAAFDSVDLAEET